MPVNLDKHVTKNGDSWDVDCPVNDGTCGARGGPSFTSTGWPTKTVARARLDEHIAEHKGEAVASTLEEFRAKHGLTPTEDGQRAVVTAKDL